jgi:ATP-dependent protease ClpP protease subunit
MKRLAFEDSRPIQLWITSRGGDVDMSFVIHDAIRASLAPVHTIGIGHVYSAAGLILACGVKRYVTPNTLFMCHETEVNLGSNTFSVGKIMHDVVSWQESLWVELMAKYSGKPVAFWRDKLKNVPEFWAFGASEIAQLGIIDGVFDPKNKETLNA